MERAPVQVCLGFIWETMIKNQNLTASGRDGHRYLFEGLDNICKMGKVVNMYVRLPIDLRI
jgi:hypothetical protein